MEQEGQYNTNPEQSAEFTSSWREIADHIDILHNRGYNIREAASDLRDELIARLLQLRHQRSKEVDDEKDAILDEIIRLGEYTKPDGG